MISRFFVFALLIGTVYLPAQAKVDRQQYQLVYRAAMGDMSVYPELITLMEQQDNALYFPSKALSLMERVTDTGDERYIDVLITRFTQVNGANYSPQKAYALLHRFNRGTLAMRTFFAWQSGIITLQDAHRIFNELVGSPAASDDPYLYLLHAMLLAFQTNLDPAQKDTLLSLLSRIESNVRTIGFYPVIEQRLLLPIIAGGSLAPHMVNQHPNLVLATDGDVGAISMADDKLAMTDELFERAKVKWLTDSSDDHQYKIILTYRGKSSQAMFDHYLDSYSKYLSKTDSVSAQHARFTQKSFVMDLLVTGQTLQAIYTVIPGPIIQ